LELFLARLFDGLSAGATYAVIAVALVLIYKATTLINFAQGELAMLGSFVVYIFAVEQGMPIWVAIVIAMALTAVLAAGIERVLIRPFDPADHLPLVIITLGLFLVINAIAGMVWGFDPRSFPQMFPSGDVWTFGIARLRWYTVGTLATVLILLVGLTLLLRKTKVGLAFRAVSSNLESAGLVGVRAGPTLQFGWMLATAVGTLAGALFVADPFRQLDPTWAQRVLIFAAAAAVLGGLDSLWGALAGGIILGMVESMVVGYIDFIPSQMGLAAAVVAIIIVLLIRPNGLFGSRTVERV
jgi:branched-chain amino acid transport system permease protein